jgi:hypothetical protein
MSLHDLISVATAAASGSMLDSTVIVTE